MEIFWSLVWKCYGTPVKKVFVFQNICFKVLALKRFNKNVDLSSGGLIYKSLGQFFRTIYALSVGFKVKAARQSVFLCSDINQLKFATWTVALVAKFELVYARTQENALSCRFYFKANRKSIDCSKKLSYSMNHFVQTSVPFNIWQWNS